MIQRGLEYILEEMDWDIEEKWVGLTNARIEIRINWRMSKKNQTHTIEMLDIWATEGLKIVIVDLFCLCLFYFHFVVLYQPIVL